MRMRQFLYIEEECSLLRNLQSGPKRICYPLDPWVRAGRQAGSPPRETFPAQLEPRSGDGAPGCLQLRLQGLIWLFFGGGA